MKYPIIGFSGYARSGKTTAANNVTLDFHNSVVCNFAEPIKRMAVAFGLSNRQVYGDLKDVPAEEFGGHTPRHIMQTLGTEWGRNCIHEDVWIFAARQRMKGALRDGLMVVFDDVRFENEARMIRNMGGIVIEVVRDGTKPKGVIHPSERPPMPDYWVQNNGDIVALAKQVKSIVGDSE